jgi:CBS domain protein
MQAVRKDVVRVTLGEPVAEVRERVKSSPYRFAIVTDPDGILIGIVCHSDLG